MNGWRDPHRSRNDNGQQQWRNRREQSAMLGMLPNYTLSMPRSWTRSANTSTS
jgi:hypothetical protein